MSHYQPKKNGNNPPHIPGGILLWDHGQDLIDNEQRPLVLSHINGAFLTAGACMREQQNDKWTTNNNIDY